MDSSRLQKNCFSQSSANREENNMAHLVSISCSVVGCFFHIAVQTSRYDSDFIPLNDLDIHHIFLKLYCISVCQ